VRGGFAKTTARIRARASSHLRDDSSAATREYSLDEEKCQENLLNATTPCQDDDVCALAGEVPVTTLSSEMA
jgi:hypothetical protein